MHQKCHQELIKIEQKLALFPQMSSYLPQPSSQHHHRTELLCFLHVCQSTNPLQVKQHYKRPSSPTQTFNICRGIEKKNHVRSKCPICSSSKYQKHPNFHLRGLKQVTNKDILLLPFFALLNIVLTSQLQSNHHRTSKELITWSNNI